MWFSSSEERWIPKVEAPVLVSIIEGRMDPLTRSLSFGLLPNLNKAVREDGNDFRRLYL